MEQGEKEDEEEEEEEIMRRRRRRRRETRGEARSLGQGYSSEQGRGRVMERSTN